AKARARPQGRRGDGADRVPGHDGRQRRLRRDRGDTGQRRRGEHQRVRIVQGGRARLAGRPKPSDRRPDDHRGPQEPDVQPGDAAEAVGERGRGL
ncbi:MAG: Putative DNA-binding protein HU-beta (ACLAME 290), partial [uncultured Thermomicrobiales bacterium]